MADLNLVGRCGLYCGHCSVYRAYKDSRSVQEEIAERKGCLPEEVRCEGCSAMELSGWAMEDCWGKNCPIYKCLNARKIQFCFECAAYETCEKFARHARMNLKELRIDLRENNRMIKAGRVEEWLEIEDEKWRCPECGRPIMIEAEKCHWCNRPLGRGKAKENESRSQRES